MKEEEYLVLVTLYDYTARNYQKRTKSPNDREVLEVDEVKPAKLAQRVFIYPPTSDLFLVSACLVPDRVFQMNIAFQKVVIT